MKTSIFILSESVLSQGNIVKHTTREFPSPAIAKQYITSTLLEEKSKASASGSVQEIETLGGTDMQSMFGQALEGTFSYKIGPVLYHYSFLKTQSEYEVGDKKMVTILERYCNTGRTGSSYRETAELITNSMHRYIQSQLWRFVKEIIRAFARMNTDLRNKQAANEAATIAEYMETESI